MRLRSGSLSAIALFQKVHLRLRFFCLFAFTELTLLMHRIGTFAKSAMRLRAGGLSAIALLQKVHLRLRAGGLSAIALFQKVHLRLRFFCLFAFTKLALLVHRIGVPAKSAIWLMFFVAYLRAPDLRFGTLRMNTLVWQHMNRCLFARWACKHQRGEQKGRRKRMGQWCRSFHGCKREVVKCVCSWSPHLGFGAALQAAPAQDPLVHLKQVPP